MHQDRGALPITWWCLVDRHVPAGMPRGCTLAGVELASPRQRTLCLLHRRTLEQGANLTVGLTILGRRGLWKAMEQGHCGGDVLARSSKARKGFIIGDDPPVYIAGHGTCAPTVSAAFDLSIEHCALLYKLDSGFLDLSLSGFQLLHPHVRWGHYLPFGFITKVAHRGASSVGMLLMCPSGVPVMKHSREG